MSRLARIGLIALVTAFAAPRASGAADSPTPARADAPLAAATDAVAAQPPATASEVRTVTYANGDRYEGEWQDGGPHGQGTYRWAGGDRYRGEWREGRMHGQGTFVWSNGTLYEGGWRGGLRHGTGTYGWADGDRITGEWRQGRRQVARAECLGVNTTARRTALWTNRCEAGVDVLWRDEGACRSTETDRWPCSWYVGPQDSAKAAIDGQVWWRECRSIGGLGDVVATEKDDGAVFCIDDASLDTMARIRRKRQRAERSVLEAETRAPAERPARPRTALSDATGAEPAGAVVRTGAGPENQDGGGDSAGHRRQCSSPSNEACAARTGETM